MTKEAKVEETASAKASSAEAAKGRLPPSRAEAPTARAQRGNKSLAAIEDESRSKRRSGAKDSTEAIVRKMTAKCIRDNFATFTEAEVHKVRQEGKTLFETIFQDKMLTHLKDPAAPKYGRLYFDSLRSIYSRGTQAELLQAEEDEDVDPTLFEAVDLSRAKPPKREKLLLFLKTSTHTANRTETIGLIQHAFELNPSHTNYNLNIELATFLVRVGVPTRFQREWRVYLGHLDSVLCFGYSHLRAKGWGVQMFCSVHQNLIEQLLPWEAIARLLMVSDSWEGAEADIEAVCSHSNTALGEKMFSFARIASMATVVSRGIMQQITHDLEEGDLTRALVDACRRKILDKLKSDFRPEDLERPKVISMHYLGNQELTLEVQNTWAEMNIRIDTMIKLAALSSCREDDADRRPCLTPLLCELDLAPIPIKREARKIDVELLAKFQVPAAQQKFGDHVTGFFASHGDTLKMLDPSVVVEIAFFQAEFTDGAKAQLHRALLVELPPGLRPESIQQVLSGIEKLKNHNSYVYGNDAAKSEVNIVCEWVRNLALGAPPCFRGVEDDQNLKELQGRLEHLAKCKVTDGDREKTLSGKDAIQHLQLAVEAKLGEGGEVTLGDLKVFESFSWMLDQAQKEKHTGWVQKVFAQTSPGGALAAPKTRLVTKTPAAIASSASSSSAAATKLKRGSSTMDLFKRRRTT